MGFGGICAVLVLLALLSTLYTHMGFISKKKDHCRYLRLFVYVGSSYRSKFSRQFVVDWIHLVFFSVAILIISVK